MKFEYIGFRPIISKHGVSFKQGKDDKFIYFPYVYEIIDSLSHDYSSSKDYSYNIKIDKANIEKLYNKVSSNFPSLKEDIERKLENYKKYLENQIEDIKSQKTLDEIEKQTFIANLEIMKDYRTNRAKNKIFYYYGILAIAHIIRDNKIKEINIPFNEKFWHTLKTLQGVLASEKINSNLKVDYVNTKLTIKLTTSL